jgi:hypothetical protein
MSNHLYETQQLRAEARLYGKHFSLKYSTRLRVADRGSGKPLRLLYNVIKLADKMFYTKVPLIASVGNVRITDEQTIS